VNEVQRYEFDRQGFLVIESMLSAEQVARLAQAVDSLEEHAVARIDAPPRKRSSRGSEYHHDPDLGYHVEGSREEGATVIIEDFWNADPAFDLLIGHQPTMKYVCAVIQGRATINNSEIRIRYRGNQSTNHGGTGPANSKYRYHVNQHGINCMMVRMVYFLHDVSREQGAFCVVPGTHKGNFDCPYDTRDPDVEPGVVGLEVRAGDAIFFTEALRHGGLTNRSKRTRKTIHVGYGPFWMKSQNIATMDEDQYLLPQTYARYTPEQRQLFRAWPTTLEREFGNHRG
jgi:ectoine hydroxylase-related dioxygenase (phytanoyl-CoA dioxygenase family)